MGQLFGFSLVSSLILSVMYVAYHRFLAHEKSHELNRMVILAIYVLSFLLSPITLIMRNGASGSVVMPEFNTVEIEDRAVAEITVADTGVAEIMLAVYLVGVVMALGFVMVSMVRLMLILNSSRRMVVDGRRVYVTGQKVAPFTVGGRVVINSEDIDANVSMIIDHEMAHVGHRHWIDLMLSQVVCVVQWYNPCAWLLGRDMRVNHEYQADAGALAEGAPIKEYQTLLIKKTVGNRFEMLANSMNHSNFKDRITMMYSQKPTGVRRLRALLLLPALVAAVTCVNLPSVAAVINDCSATRLPEVDGGKVNETLLNTEAKNVATDDDEVYRLAEQMPEYPGGPKALMEKLASVIDIPESIPAESRKGYVVVQFVVDAEGQVSSPKVVRSISPELDKAAIDAVLKLGRFIPAKTAGKAVSVYYTLPVRMGNPEVKPDKQGDLKVTALFVDGEKMPMEELKNISPEKIESMSVVRDNPDYPDGAIYIVLKK